MCAVEVSTCSLETGGTACVAGYRVEALAQDRARLTLTLDVRGFQLPMSAA